MTKKIWMFGLLFLAITSLFVACGGSEEAACGTDDDCASNQVCEDGACKTVSEVRCTGNPDCPGGQCINEVCQPLPNPDMSANNTNNQNNVNNMQDMGMDMPDPDNVNPEVVSVDPEDGAEDVAVDATITVTFSEPLDLFTVNNQSLLLKSPAGDVTTTVDYDEESNSATITPSNPLLAATGYRVVPTAFLRDVAGNTLRIDPDPSTRFFTGIEEPAHHTALAEKFAPVIYQSIEDTGTGRVNRDIPTTVDFDGNFRARDNKSNSQLGVTRTEAHVYYSVVESHTHYFVTYALYYPIRRDKSADISYEHDFTGAVFVIDKATESLKLVEGIKVDSGNDTIIAYKPDSSGVSGTGQPQFLESFQDARFEGDRYPMFVTSGTHEACNWWKEGPTLPAVCRHDEAAFSDNGDGVKMTPGDAQTFQQAMDTDGDNIPEMTYALVPMSTTLWARRSSVSNDGLWELLSVYTPIDQRPAVYPVTMDPVLWMNRLVSDDDQSYGKPPMAWFKLSADSNEGQWLYDPAYLLTVRYNFDTDYSNDYCYNYFLGLDSLDDANVAACATPGN